MKLSVLVLLGTALAELINPFKDPFYTEVATEYKHLHPGDIIDYRRPPLRIRMRNVREAWQIRYRTTDSRGNPDFALTTLIIPPNAPTNKLISYQYAEDASYLMCAPSHLYQRNSGDGMIQRALESGYIVNSPDYEGPRSAFTAGILAGHSVLDSIRAVLSFKKFRLDADVRIALWGYSGGSLASGWAAQLQPSYAPELNISGTAIGGLVSNITAVAEFVNAKPAAGFLPAGLWGLAAEYPEFATWMQDNVNPNNGSQLEAARRQCMIANGVRYLKKDVLSYFKTGQNTLYEPVVAKVMGQLTMGESAPNMPIFLYHGQEDDIIPANLADDTARAWCNKGARVELHKITGLDHIKTMDAMLEAAMQWIIKLLRGEPVVEKGCSTIIEKPPFPTKAV